MHERYWIILFNKKLQWHIQKGLKFLPGYSNAALRTCAKHKDRFDQIEKKELTCSSLFCAKLMFSYLKVMELCSWGWKLDVPSQPKPFHDSIMMKFCSSSSNLWFLGPLEAKSQFHFWHKCTCKPQRIIEALGEILHLTAQNPTTRYKAELGWCHWYSSETLIKLGTAMEQGKAIKAPKCRQE